jgi:hypothetical protein
VLTERRCDPTAVDVLGLTLPTDTCTCGSAVTSSSSLWAPVFVVRVWWLRGWVRAHGWYTRSDSSVHIPAATTAVWSTCSANDCWIPRGAGSADAQRSRLSACGWRTARDRFGDMGVEEGQKEGAEVVEEEELAQTDAEARRRERVGGAVNARGGFRRRDPVAGREGGKGARALWFKLGAEGREWW